MYLFTNDLLDEYLVSDPLFSPLATSTHNEKTLQSHLWMTDSSAKRMIFWHMYKDLLTAESHQGKVLDIGGGYTGLSKLVSKNCNYILVDILAHEKTWMVEDMAKASKHDWAPMFWQKYIPGPCDLIICNDLFVNVDQSLELFLQRYLPSCKKMRLSLTFHNTPKTYTLRDTISSRKEIYTMMAWNGAQLELLLSKYQDRIEGYDPSILSSNESIFSNGRQVCQMTMRGNL